MNRPVLDLRSEGPFTAEVGTATVDIFDNGYVWVMRFSDANGRFHNRLTLGHGMGQIMRLRDAFERALFGFHSQFPIVMVGGVEFSVFEARDIRDLLARVAANG